MYVATNQQRQLFMTTTIRCSWRLCIKQHMFLSMCIYIWDSLLCIFYHVNSNLTINRGREGPGLAVSARVGLARCYACGLLSYDQRIPMRCICMGPTLLLPQLVVAEAPPKLQVLVTGYCSLYGPTRDVYEPSIWFIGTECSFAGSSPSALHKGTEDPERLATKCCDILKQ